MVCSLHRITDNPSRFIFSWLSFHYCSYTFVESGLLNSFRFASDEASNTAAMSIGVMHLRGLYIDRRVACFVISVHSTRSICLSRSSFYSHRRFLPVNGCYYRLDCCLTYWPIVVGCCCCTLFVQCIRLVRIALL